MHIHCFTDTREFASDLLKNFENAYIGFTGICTYGSAKNVQQLVKEVVPLERMLLETDGPYLPAQYSAPSDKKQGKKGAQQEAEEKAQKKVKAIAHCAHAFAVAQKIATLKQISVAKVLEQTRQNAEYVYSVKF